MMLARLGPVVPMASCRPRTALCAPWCRLQTCEHSTELIPGEPLYAVKPGTFPAIYIKIGKVKA